MKNAEQHRIVKHRLGPAQVIAVPGSGKTTTLCKRVNHLLRHKKCEAREILVLTYSDTTKRDIAKRIEHPDINVQTFHAFSLSIVATDNRLNAGTKIKVVPIDDFKYLTKAMVGWKNPSNFDEEELKGWFLLANKRGQKIVDYLKRGTTLSRDERNAIGRLDSRHAKVLAKKGIVSFQQMQERGLELLDRSVVRKRLSHIKYVFVDEFQDTHPIQIEILKRLFRITQNIMVFGDPMQVLYGFRGVVYKNLADVLAAPVHSYPLSRSFRLTRENAQLANTIAENAKCTEAITIRSVDSGPRPLLVKAPNLQAAQFWITKRLRKLLDDGVAAQNIAILAANRSVLLEYERALRVAKIPFVPKARPVAPREMAAFRSLLVLILRLKKSISKERLEKLTRSIARTISGERKTHLKPHTFKNVIRDLRNCAKSDSVQSNVMGAGTALKRMLRACDVNPKNFDVRLKESTATANINSTLKGFLSDPIWEHGADAITTSTIHGAKGLEWKYVFLVGLIDGVLPYRFASRDNLDEQRRVFYVGATRAKKRLYLLEAPMFAPSKFKPTFLAEPSPFSTELVAAGVVIVKTIKPRVTAIKLAV